MLAIGLLLNQLFDRVGQVIQEAQNTGLILEVNAGAQAQNLITQARESFKDVLDKAASDLSAQQQQLVSGINGIVDNLEHHILDDILPKIQTVANALPGANHFPQLASITGNVIARSGGDDVTVTLNGNFFDLPRDDYEATLRIGSGTVTSATRMTSAITFQLSKTNLAFADSKITYVPCAVDIQYRVSVLLGIAHHKATATFRMMLMLLPASPGYFVLQASKLGDVRQEVTDQCSNLVWDSADDDVDKVDGCNMSDGWQCIRETVSYSFTRCEGDKDSDWFDLGNASTPTYVGWHFKTAHHGLGTSGKLTATLRYRKWKTVQQQLTSTSDSVPLNWGDSKVLIIDPTASWKIIYHQFDGVAKEFAGSDLSNPYLKIHTAGNQVTLRVIPQ